MPVVKGMSGIGRWTLQLRDLHHHPHFVYNVTPAVGKGSGVQHPYLGNDIVGEVGKIVKFHHTNVYWAIISPVGL